jgi:glycosyltransferase involved in cell wall biosynthesis
MSGKNRPRIMHLRSSEFFGGPERAILGQSQYLRDRYDFVCASFLRPGQECPFFDRAGELGLPTRAIPQQRTLDFGPSRLLADLITQEQIDLVVSHDYKANFFGNRACGRTGIAHIRHFRGNTTEDLKVRLYNFLDKLMLQRMKKVLVVSGGTRHKLVGMGVPESKITVVPNAIEDHKLVAADFERPAPGPDGPTFVSAGRLSLEKGYDVLLRAIAGIKDRCPPWRMEIYGDGPEEQQLLGMVQELGLQEIVHFKGFVDDILPILERAGAMVLPSRTEGMPNILLEAWAKKLGVVSTSVGGVPEMIQSGVHGLLVEPEDPAALGQAILQALEQPDLVRQMGAAGFERVRERYSYPAQSTILGPIYDAATAGSPFLEAVR